ncbi:probable 28S ribosomal protein S26, mitochondrial [Monomorium pharaonis]|uniref:probable 28S ribosomal protein S26, mitochondrial n=1 Tax=Monomorium pharaonis TaxID=307658 RepID=UPI00063FA1A9|nr:probable 28S ribosomal protein S26, mitochondrial [Monomorium pharaonis]XP_012526255.1 probable 28S ribosomal protein S26, mitochondrial [Monomorium pharaonis]
MQTMRIMNTLTMGLCETFVPNSVYTQCVRWKRKPIWLPTAKSKVFRVPKRPVIPIEEKEELQRLYNNYKTYMTSFRAYLWQIAQKNKVQLDKADNVQLEEEDFKKCSAINDEWNAEIAEKREIRLEEMRAERRNTILQNLLRHEQKKEMKIARLNELVRKVKEESVTFITAENVDAAIEECLTKVVNHNRALDLEGNWHEGKYPPVPPLEETQKSMAVEQ